MALLVMAMLRGPVRGRRGTLILPFAQKWIVSPRTVVPKGQRSFPCTARMSLGQPIPTSAQPWPFWAAGNKRPQRGQEKAKPSPCGLTGTKTRGPSRQALRVPKHPILATQACRPMPSDGADDRKLQFLKGFQETVRFEVRWATRRA